MFFERLVLHYVKSLNKYTVARQLLLRVLQWLRQGLSCMPFRSLSTIAKFVHPPDPGGCSIETQLARIFGMQNFLPGWRTGGALTPAAEHLVVINDVGALRGAAIYLSVWCVMVMT